MIVTENDNFRVNANRVVYLDGLMHTSFKAAVESIHIQLCPDERMEDVILDVRLFCFDFYLEINSRSSLKFDYANFRARYYYCLQYPLVSESEPTDAALQFI